MTSMANKGRQPAPYRPVSAFQCYLAYLTALAAGIGAWWILVSRQIPASPFLTGLLITAKYSFSGCVNDSRQVLRVKCITSHCISKDLSKCFILYCIIFTLDSGSDLGKFHLIPCHSLCNVGIGKDHTIFATAAGRVSFRKTRARTIVSVEPTPSPAE